MLSIEKLTKKYEIGAFKQLALNEVSMTFRKQEFVSILGPSGSGKTTLLNMIGGLDRYDSGDIIINNKSTKHFKDADWDSYRNHSIGFVFQSYNLIPHISVLDNVEIGLTLSGDTQVDRKKRAMEVLERVGLIDHVHKKPNQLSGGQMQRVAIARALVNSPDIILADEPTGSLDTETSTQIMALIQEIAKDKLVIMVTHNQDIATEYSSRIIELKDGKVIGDSDPYEIKKDEPSKFSLKRTSMSFLQALKLSFNNLKTKKFRTLTTAFAGSIGIIGVALVLSLSNGLGSEIDKLETSALGEFPITISEFPQQVEFGPPTPEFEEEPLEDFPDTSAVYVYDREATRTTHVNTINDEYIDYLMAMDEAIYNEIQMSRSVTMPIYTENFNGDLIRVNRSDAGLSELPNNIDYFNDTYDLLTGSIPNDTSEILLVVDEYNRLTVDTLSALGFETNDMNQYDFNDFIGKEFTLVFNDDYYLPTDETNERFMVNQDTDQMVENGMTLTITGVARVNPETSMSIVSSGVKYLPALTDMFLEDAETSNIVQAQTDNDINVLTGTPLNDQSRKSILRSIGALSVPSQINIYSSGFDEKESVKAYLDEYNASKESDDQIIYTDLAELITDIVSTTLNTTTYVLIAFSAISLVVSSIMIGIITYVSVLERTKEIGILRSLGARKRDISRVFNAETTIIGFTAGSLGVIIAFLLTIPINIIIENLVDDVENIASLAVSHALFLIAISIVLTYISGLIPSGIAARKNPVDALRVE